MGACKGEPEKNDDLCFMELLLPIADLDRSLLGVLASISLHFVSVSDRFLVICSTSQILSPNNTLSRTYLPAMIQLPDNDLWCLAYTSMAHLAIITLTLSYWLLGQVMASDWGDGVPKCPFWTYWLARLFPPFRLCYRICALLQHSGGREERPRVPSKASAFRTATSLPAAGSTATHDVLLSSAATKHS